MEKQISVLKIKLYINKYKTLIYSLLSIIFIAICCLILKISNILSIVSTNSNLSGAVGTTFGAIVGGVFTLIGSIYVNNKQIIGNSEIRRKNIIYRPLYDELIEINDILINQNPYPNYIKFTKGLQTFVPHPQFSAWNRINGDSRRILIPEGLKISYANLFSILERYIDAKRIANSEIKNKINEILFSECGIRSNIANLGDVISSDVILKRRPCGTLIKECIKPFDDKKSLNLSDEVLRMIDEKIYYECNELSTVKNLISIYNEWINLQEKIINVLELMIKVVNMKYEKQM